MNMEKWKNFEESEQYQISNFGRAKSLKFGKEKILKSFPTTGGYLQISTHKNKVRKDYRVHQLVAIAFLGHKPNGHNKVIRHLDGNQLNNHVNNLAVGTPLENAHDKPITGASKYRGVTRHKDRWRAKIKIKGKSIHLGLFDKEIEASNAYQTKLNERTIFTGVN